MNYFFQEGQKLMVLAHPRNKTVYLRSLKIPKRVSQGRQKSFKSAVKYLNVVRMLFLGIIFYILFVITLNLNLLNFFSH